MKKINNIAVVGLGLIGGSFAYALKKYTDCRVIGINRSISTQIKAKNAGAIDKIGNEDDLAEADVVILGLYPQLTIDYVCKNFSRFKKGAVIIDTCGIKSDIVAKLTGVSENYGFVFIGGHPMAGKEQYGFDAAEADLFRGASMILTPVTDEQKRTANEIMSIFYEIGFRNVVVTEPERHDKVIAFTSQIPHVLANAYVKSPASRDFDGFSAGSFRDVSRVASLNVPMWTELFMQNKAALTEQIDILLKNITDIRDAINQGDDKKLYSLLEEGNLIKENLNIKELNRNAD